MSAEYRSLSGPKRLGDRLLEAGLITRTHLDAALEQQHAGGEPRPRLGRTLVDLGFVAERDLMQMLSVHLAIPLAAFPITAPDARARGAIPAGLARRHRAIPCRVENGALLVAVGTPLEPGALGELETAAQLPVRLHLAPEADIASALATHFDELCEDGIAAPACAAVDEAAPDPLSPSTERLTELVNGLRELANRHHRLSNLLVSAGEESRRLAAESESLIDAARQLFERHTPADPAWQVLPLTQVSAAGGDRAR
jgi:hypothetical protein